MFCNDDVWSRASVFSCHVFVTVWRGWSGKGVELQDP